MASRPRSSVPAIFRSKRFHVVPKGKTYVKLDAKGKEIARYSADQVMAETADCVTIRCPSTFPKDYVCWQCQARPESSAAGGSSAAVTGQSGLR